MKKNGVYLLPLGLILFVLCALSLSPLTPLAGAQGGQKPSAPATTPSSAETSASSSDPRLSYPVTKKTEQVDNYHGTIVADPFRWSKRTTHPRGRHGWKRRTK